MFRARFSHQQPPGWCRLLAARALLGFLETWNRWAVSNPLTWAALPLEGEVLPSYEVAALAAATEQEHALEAAIVREAEASNAVVNPHTFYRIDAGKTKEGDLISDMEELKNSMYTTVNESPSCLTVIRVNGSRGKERLEEIVTDIRRYTGNKPKQLICTVYGVLPVEGQLIYYIEVKAITMAIADMFLEYYLAARSRFNGLGTTDKLLTEDVVHHTRRPFDDEHDEWVASRRLHFIQQLAVLLNRRAQ